VEATLRNSRLIIGANPTPYRAAERMIASATSAALTADDFSTSVHSSSACARSLGPRPMVIAEMPRMIGIFESVLLMP